ncbi:MAG: putative membrane protein [Salibacteraceae bacterium]|jgi:predicted membrane protein
MDIQTNNNARQQKSKILGGVLIVSFGILYFLEKTGANIPHWLVSWETILIAIGIVSLYKHNFRHLPGFIMVGVGTVFLINEFRPNFIDSNFILPVVVILIGLSVIGRSLNLFGMNKKDTYIFDEEIDQSSEDFVKSTTLFGGVKKSIVSKTFKGANFDTKFGGTEINLSQADIQQPVVIHSTTALGGLKIIVPSNWQVKSEISAIFGSVEDKRAPISDLSRDPNKVLILKGNCTFGGVEIISYV